jgi:hypothetical protein
MAARYRHSRGCDEGFSSAARCALPLPLPLRHGSANL